MYRRITYNCSRRFDQKQELEYIITVNESAKVLKNAKKYLAGSSKEIFDEIDRKCACAFGLIDIVTAVVAQDEVASHFLKSNTRS